MFRYLGLATATFINLAAAQEPLPENGAAMSEPASSPTNRPEWSVPEPVDFVCPFKGDFDYEPGEIECGFIAVPENRDDPDSRIIRLHFVRIAATGEESEVRSDPVIYLTGGPGAGVNSYVKRLKDHAIVEQRDLYILEQRGIGASGNLCPDFGLTERALTHSGDIEEAQRNATEVTRNCFEVAQAAGVDLTGYNTVENARDVKALRQALGFEQWNVWGISYGSHLGQMLALQDPEGIRALVIDAIVPNDLTDLMRIGRWANLVLDNVFSICTERADCERMEKRLDSVLEELRGNPIRVKVDDTELFPQGELRVDGLLLVLAPFMMSYEQDQHPAIPAVMNALIGYFETRDDAFFELVTEIDPTPGGVSISQGMGEAIRCNDGYVHATEAVVEDDLAENPRFRGLATPAGAAYAARMCEEQGLAPRDRLDYRFVESAIPTLIVNGAWDPITPPAMAEYIAPGFSNGRYIEVPYAGHGPTRSMSDCAGPVLNAFFDNPDPGALDASCLEEGVGAPEYLAFKATRAPILLGARAAENPKQLIAPGLWAGIPLLVLLFGLLAIPVSALGRRIDPLPADDRAQGLSASRWLGFLTAISGVGFAALAAYGFYAGREVSEIAILAGLHPAGAAALWLSVATGLLGLLLLVALLRRRQSGGPIRIGPFVGLLLVGISGLALSTFAIAYDLSLF
jgi:pimeloyl-ACP methyl ester carboxylesterase